MEGFEVERSFAAFIIYNMPINFHEVNPQRVHELYSKLPRIPLENLITPISNVKLSNAALRDALYSISVENANFRNAIVTARVLYDYFLNLATKMDSKNEEGIQTFVLKNFFELQSCYRLIREISNSIDAVVNMWNYIASAINMVYCLNIPFRECSIRKVLQSEKLGGRFKRLEMHMGFKSRNSPFRRISGIRNQIKHHGSLVTKLLAYAKSNAVYYNNNENGDDYKAVVYSYLSGLNDLIDKIISSYKHFAKGYGLFFEQVKKDFISKV